MYCGTRPVQQWEASSWQIQAIKLYYRLPLFCIDWTCESSHQSVKSPSWRRMLRPVIGSAVPNFAAPVRLRMTALWVRVQTSEAKGAKLGLAPVYQWGCQGKLSQTGNDLESGQPLVVGDATDSQSSRSFLQDFKLLGASRLTQR